MRTATTPRHGPRGTRLLTVDADGRIDHHTVSDLPALVRAHDVFVANDAATLPASLAGVHEPTGEPIELRLAAHLQWPGTEAVAFTALAFGAGDYRVPTEQRPQPPLLRDGDGLRLGPLHARVTAVSPHPRLIDVRFDDPAAAVWEGLARHGRPIQYAHVPLPLAIGDTWTSIAGRAVAFEAPSAGFILSWSLLGLLRARGVAFATVTHAAGLSSTGDPALDRLLPLDEGYVVPPDTARLIARARQHGGRVIAIGTSVVRALEHAARGGRGVTPGAGVATGRITSSTRLQVVDAIVSGVHEPGTSHYELLGAFQHAGALAAMSSEADASDYRTHEFGDAVLVVRGRNRDAGRQHRTNAA